VPVVCAGHRINELATLGIVDVVGRLVQNCADTMEACASLLRQLFGSQSCTYLFVRVWTWACASDRICLSASGRGLVHPIVPLLFLPQRWLTRCVWPFNARAAFGRWSTC